MLYRFFALLLSFVCTVMMYQTRSMSIQVTMMPGTVESEEVEYKNR